MEIPKHGGKAHQVLMKRGVQILRGIGVPDNQISFPIKRTYKENGPIPDVLGYHHELGSIAIECGTLSPRYTYEERTKFFDIVIHLPYIKCFKTYRNPWYLFGKWIRREEDNLEWWRKHHRPKGKFLIFTDYGFYTDFVPKVVAVGIKNKETHIHEKVVLDVNALLHPSGSHRRNLYRLTIPLEKEEPLISETLL